MTGENGIGAVRVHGADNVATAIADIAAGYPLFADDGVRAAVAVATLSAPWTRTAPIPFSPVIAAQRRA